MVRTDFVSLAESKMLFLEVHRSDSVRILQSSQSVGNCWDWDEDAHATAAAAGRQLLMIIKWNNHALVSKMRLLICVQWGRYGDCDTLTLYAYELNFRKRRDLQFLS